MLPSFASILDENWPPTRRSTAAAVVCQSSDAAFHCLMSSGVVHARQTSSTGAATVVSTVICMAFLSSFRFRGSTHSSNDARRDRHGKQRFMEIVASVCPATPWPDKRGGQQGTFSRLGQNAGVGRTDEGAP